MSHEFGVGKYQILLPEEIYQAGITVIDGKHCIRTVTDGQDGTEILAGGAAFVKVQPPTSLLMPFLQYRTEEGFTFLSLCRRCSELRQKVCRHRAVSSRSFTSSWMVTDLDMAVSLGYKVIEWYEIHHFPKKSALLKDYVKILNGEKIKNSGGLQNMTSEAEKKSYCDSLNERMNLPQQFELNSENVINNSAQKQTFKMLCNSFYGKFSQNSNFTKIDLIQERSHLLEIVNSQEVIDISSLSDNFVQIEYQPSTEKTKPNLKGSLYIGAEINALARVFMYKSMLKIVQAQGTLFAVDTDGLFYSLPKDVPDPLPFSDAVGDFKSVYPEILNFLALGNRNYSLSYKSSDGKIKNVTKIKGLSLSSHNLSDSLSSDTYREYIDSHFQNEYKNIYLPQLRQTVNKDTKEPEDKMQRYNFSNDLFLKRFVCNEKPPTYVTYPYGYRFQKLKK